MCTAKLVLFFIHFVTFTSTLVYSVIWNQLWGYSGDNLESLGELINPPLIMTPAVES